MKHLPNTADVPSFQGLPRLHFLIACSTASDQEMEVGYTSTSLQAQLMVTSYIHDIVICFVCYLGDLLSTPVPAMN